MLGRNGTEAQRHGLQLVVQNEPFQTYVSILFIHALWFTLALSKDFLRSSGQGVRGYGDFTRLYLDMHMVEAPMNASKPGNEDVFFFRSAYRSTLVHAYVYVYVLGHKRDQIT